MSIPSINHSLHFAANKRPRRSRGLRLTEVLATHPQVERGRFVPPDVVTDHFFRQIKAANNVIKENEAADSITKIDEGLDSTLKKLFPKSFPKRVLNNNFAKPPTMFVLSGRRADRVIQRVTRLADRELSNLPEFQSNPPRLNSPGQSTPTITNSNPFERRNVKEILLGIIKYFDSDSPKQIRTDLIHALAIRNAQLLPRTRNCVLVLDYDEQDTITGLRYGRDIGNLSPFKK